MTLRTTTLKAMLGAACFCASAAASPAGVLPSMNVVPLPARHQVEREAGPFVLGSQTSFALLGAPDPRAHDGVVRLLRQWEARTGFTFARTDAGEIAFGKDEQTAGIVFECEESGPDLPRLGEDESYTLHAAGDRVVLKARRTVGLLRGLATLTQLLTYDRTRWLVPGIQIKDEPRFPWRGLLLDTSRHFMPVETVKRQLDAMALVKLNVLHFHLSDDQGFRIESRVYPKLHELASEGQYYTQDEVREIVRYAAGHGIRVVPEFDVPGHTAAMLTAYPELGTMPGPYHLITNWGIFSPVLDPTKEEVYVFLERLFGEMAGLFPDEYFHIGGDEVDGKHWSASEHTRRFIEEKKLVDNHGLHAHFNQRLQTIISRIGKKMMGWDEILHPELPKEAIVHAWQGPERLIAAAKAGHQVVLSAGYYLDLMLPVWDHYSHDPLAKADQLTAEERQRVIGGEACMWAEWISPETIDGRLWPRAGAVAERLWSPADVRDVADLYRRLKHLSLVLESHGLRHETNRAALIRRFAGPETSPHGLELLTRFAELTEPVKRYERNGHFPGVHRSSPLTNWVDISRPESVSVWALGEYVKRLLTATTTPTSSEWQLPLNQIKEWGRLAAELKAALPHMSPRAQELAPLIDSIGQTCAIGVLAIEARLSGDPVNLTASSAKQQLAEASKPHLAVMNPLAPIVGELLHSLR